jgi:ABC-type glycerol-3-phosphate transport system substrate-binding protein
MKVKFCFKHLVTIALLLMLASCVAWICIEAMFLRSNMIIAKKQVADLKSYFESNSKFAAVDVRILTNASILVYADSAMPGEVKKELEEAVEKKAPRAKINYVSYILEETTKMTR